MSWRLRIEHTTSVRYAGPVLTSFNEARMTPLTLPTQTTLDARVSAGPGVPVWTYNDYWGTYVSVFDLPDPHDGLLIRAVAMVETEGPAGVPEDGRLGWEPLREEASGGRLLEFMLPTELTTVTPQIAATVTGDLRSVPPDEAAMAISARVRERVSYMPGATGVRTDAREAWNKGQGVCQDMAHVTVALMRAAGLPARYVSGYLHPDTGPGRAAPRSGRATRGSSTGPGRGSRSTPPAAPRWGSGTWRWRAAATTPTCRRSRASTTAPRRARWTSRSR